MAIRCINPKDLPTPMCRSSKRRRSICSGMTPANVIVGVAMMSPGYLIEVDAIAVMD